MLAASETAWIADRARKLGFALCGVTRAEKLSGHEHLPEWLGRGYGGEMRYLEDPRRSDPASILPGAQTLIVCAMNYNAPQPYSTDMAAPTDVDDPRGWISRYAWGDDYHQVVLAKLKELTAALRGRLPQKFEAREYVDTGPILERAFAQRAGLGWQGKNTCLIHEELGSWLFLGVIVTTLDLAPTLGPAEAPPPDLCGNCRLCLDACPTNALVEPYMLDARLCISYLTIELRGAIPEQLRPAMGRHVFGCDICQDVCPWNRRAPATESPEFQPRTISSSSSIAREQGMAAGSAESLFHPRLEWLAGLGEKDFQQAFRGSPVKRAKWRGLVRNACVALGNSGVRRGTAIHARVCALLQRIAASENPVLAECAGWALARIE